MYYLADYVTKSEVKSENFVFTGANHPWEVIMDLDRIRSMINVEYFRKSPPFVSKYLPFLPVKNHSNFVSLQEGATPLIRSKVIGKRLGLDLYFKIESKSPTGSFKDRGSAVEVSVAKEMGAKGIAVASTGNMAASCACYAAAAGIPCFVFVPEDVPQSKLAQVIAFGGRIVQVKGSYNDAATLAHQAAEKLGFYLAGDYAFRVEGAKTAAFELIDQFYFQVPDAVLIPMGCGTNLAAYHKGFREFLSLGYIDRLPQLVGVQATGASAIVNSFHKGTNTIDALGEVNTIASAIAVPNPLDGTKALDAIYDTSGVAVAVTDQDMLKAQHMLSAEEGIFVESSGGAVLAALLKLGQGGRFAGKRVVCVLCGDGLKDPSSILKVAIKPPTVNPEINDFLSLYENKFFDGKTVAFIDKGEVVFENSPEHDELKSYLENTFEGAYSDPFIEKIQAVISKFLRKGKPITFADIQDIMQDVLASLDNKTQEVFRVLDFDVRTGMDRKPEAKVLVEVDGEQLVGKALGVGPVDAVIQALQEACEGKIRFTLKGYTVDIRSQGPDAVVYVEMKLQQSGKVSLGRGASPDILQASIEAFEEAYNGFYARAVSEN